MRGTWTLIMYNEVIGNVYLLIIFIIIAIIYFLFLLLEVKCSGSVANMLRG